MSDRQEPKPYRRKPVVVEAVQFDGTNGEAIREWSGGVVKPHFPLSLRVGTLEGLIRADAFDWIIRGADGEFYPCKPDIFTETYEKEIPE